MYLLSTYSYSFQRRLRELASPIEVYNLQVADIDESIPLSPRVQFATVHTLSVSTKSTSNGTHVCLLDVNDHSRQLNATMLFKIQHLSINKNSDLSLLSNLNLEKRILPQKSLVVSIYKCIVNKEFSIILKTWISKSNCTYLTFNFCVFTKEVTIGWMDNLFASVKLIQHFLNSYKGPYLRDLYSVLIREPSVDNKIEEYYNEQEEMFLDANLNLTLKDAISLLNYNKMQNSKKYKFRLIHPMKCSTAELKMESFKNNLFGFDLKCFLGGNTVLDVTNEVRPYFYNLF